MPLPSLSELDLARFDNPVILKRLNAATRQLAELKGVAASIPNQDILINTLTLQEARDSSAIENIVTTQDDLYRDEVEPVESTGVAVKEVLRYRQALRAGYEQVRASGLLTLNTILQIQAELECNRAGLRKLPGTALKDGAGRVVYEPPQHALQVRQLMGDLETWIHADNNELDPLVRMALIHHQFESIHPFYDGNGRTGRIINVLYLVKEGLLDIPVLYLSRHIVRTKPEYYRLLQAVRDEDAWEDWVAYMLDAVAVTAADAIQTIQGIKQLLHRTKQRIRKDYKFYSQDLINNMFSHPYTRVEFLQRDLGVSRITATRYLDALAADGLLDKQRRGRNNYYVNLPLFALLSQGSEGAQPS